MANRQPREAKNDRAIPGWGCGVAVVSVMAGSSDGNHRNLARWTVQIAGLATGNSCSFPGNPAPGRGPGTVKDHLSRAFAQPLTCLIRNDWMDVMDATLWWSLLILGLLGLSAFFSGSETALTAVERAVMQLCRWRRAGFAAHG